MSDLIRLIFPDAHLVPKRSESVCWRASFVASDVVMKICHYVRIVRQNRGDYGLEGIRAHMHNMLARLFCEIERYMGKPESTPSHKMSERMTRRLFKTQSKNV